jgi:DNA-binding HxlR family transcriptional regulator
MEMSGSDTRIYHCPVEVTLDLVGGKWKPLILWHLKENDALRHSELRRLIPGISQKVLTQQLRQLERDELVQRTQYPDVPPRVDYSMTPYGHSLHDLLDVICGWGAEHARRTSLTIQKPNSTDPAAPVSRTSA